MHPTLPASYDAPVSRGAGPLEYDHLAEFAELKDLANLTSDIAVALTTGMDLRSSLRLCVEAVVLRLDAAFARVWTLNEGESVLELQASAGMYTSITGTHSRVPVGQFKIGLIAQERKAHLTNTVLGDPRVHDQEWARREGLIAFAGHPLVVEGRLVGVLAVFSRRALSPTALNALETISHSIATGIAHWQAVDTIRASNERFELVIRATDEGIWDWNIPNDSAYVSPRFQELLGYREHEASTNALAAFELRLHPSDHDRVLAALKRHLAERCTFEEDCRVLNPLSGEYRWFHVRGHASWDSSGQARRMLGSICCIHGRKRSEACRAALHQVTKILAESSELTSSLREILQAICETQDWGIGGAWTVAADARTLRCLDFWHLPGMACDDFIATSRRMAFARGVGLPGRTWASARPHWIEDVTQDANFPRAAVATRCNLHGAIAFPLKSQGSVCGVLEFFSNKIRQPDKELLEVIEDISLQISRHLDLCEQTRVNQRQQQELAIAEKMKQANRHKDMFLATLAHELRNPLSPINNALQLWPFKRHDPDEMEKLRQIMERQVKHLVRLINDLMDSSRISGGKIRLELRPVDLGTVMCHAVETIQVAVDAGGHQLIFSPPAEPVTVIGDSTRLVQVFGNLLHNACKYTGTRGLIHFHAARHAEHVVVTVKDNGPGISAEMLPKIFHMFCQADQTLERSHGGLGIGLSLAEQLVRLHGGDIQAHSEGLGCGAEFVVTLPIAAARTSKHSAAPSQSQPALDVGLSKRRILVVDDWEEVAETLAAMLRVMGQEVMTLNDGRQVVDWIKSHPLDVAILDIAMPEMNGYEIARAIRRLPELNHVVLVAVTGFGQKRDRRRALQSGFDRQLTKPVDLPTLHALLRDLPHEPLAAPRAAGLAGTRSS